MSNGVTKQVDGIVNKQRIIELLEQAQTQIQARDQLRNDLSQYISKIKDNKEVTLNDFHTLRTKQDKLSELCLSIDGIYAQIEGFVSCYRLAKPVAQEVEELAALIDQQEGQLKQLSIMILEGQAEEQAAEPKAEVEELAGQPGS